MVGRVMWELIEPLDEEGIYARFLAEKGNTESPSGKSMQSATHRPHATSFARRVRRACR
jgi:hypothetical protein